MIRKIILLMLVLVFMVQGASAYLYLLDNCGVLTTGVIETTNSIVTVEGIGGYGGGTDYESYRSILSYTQFGSRVLGGVYWNGLTPLHYTHSETTNVFRINIADINGLYNHPCNGNRYTILITNANTTYTAYANSTVETSEFTYYLAATGTTPFTELGTGIGEVTFTIHDAVIYNISYYDPVNDVFEWHNFTASGDEIWNPTYISNNADFNFTNLSYQSPIKQYHPSIVTVDINDSDGTISTATIRIDGSNRSMQYISGYQWRYIFTDSNIIKNYYITNIYATDNEGGQDSESYNASYIHVESRTGGGGGGGGSYPPDPTIPPFLPCTLNCDDDNDGICDRNCDIDDDWICDVNCDDNDDGICDRNCDTDGDGTCDVNCDDNDDGICDRNCDTDGDGTCDVNCDDVADRPIDEDIPDDFKDLFENFRDGDIPDDFWTDKNLRIHPASLNSTAFYTGWDKPQNVTYRFLTNKFIDSCEVTNGSCTIDQRFLVNFNTIINENTTGYRGTLTVARTGETAIADIYINVINLCACKEITPWQLNISDEWAQKLVYFVRVKDGAIVCIRWWFMIALLIILLGIVWYDSNKK